MFFADRWGPYGIMLGAFVNDLGHFFDFICSRSILIFVSRSSGIGVGSQACWAPESYIRFAGIGIWLSV